MASLLGTSARCAGPVLTPQPVQAAIQEGSKYKTIDKFLEKGLKGKRVKLAGAMAKDGISKYATFFNDSIAGAPLLAHPATERNQQGRVHNDLLYDPGRG